MLKKILMVAALTGAWILTVSYTLATDQQRDQAKIYGSQMMTAQERTEYRSRMHASITAQNQEQEQIRNAQRERMRERANQRGVTLPDDPPPTNGGMISPGGDKGPGSGH